MSEQPKFQFSFEVRYTGSVTIQAPNATAARQMFNALQVPNLITLANVEPSVNVTNLQPSADFSNY